jgi:acetylglutamate kinase
VLKEEKIILDGMIPKLDNAFEALNHGVQKVRIIHAGTVKEMAENLSPGGTLLYV